MGPRERALREQREANQAQRRRLDELAVRRAGDSEGGFTVRLELRLSRAQMDLLEAKATTAGLSNSQYVRLLIEGVEVKRL